MGIFESIIKALNAKPMEQVPIQATSNPEGGLPKTMTMSFGMQGVEKNRSLAHFEFTITARQRYLLRQRHPLLTAVHNAIIKQVKKVEIEVVPIDDKKPFAEASKIKMEEFIKKGFGEYGEKELRGRLVDTKKWYGDAFAEIVFDSITKEPVMINYLISETMRILPKETGQILGYPQVVDGQLNYTFSPENILHLKEHPDEYSFFGYSDIDSLFMSLLLDSLTDEQMVENLRNNASASGALVFNDDVDDKDLSRLRWQFIVQLKQSPNKPVFLNKVKQWIPMGYDLSNINWGELHKKVRERVMMVYGVLPIQMAVVETGKLANPEQQLEIGEEYIQQELESVQSIYNLKLTPYFLNSANLMFKFKELQPKADALIKKATILKTNTEAARNLAGIPDTFTKNEIRAIIDLPVLLIGGDDLVSSPPPSFPPASPVGLATGSVEEKSLNIHLKSRAALRAKFDDALAKDYARFSKKVIKEAKQNYTAPAKSAKTISTKASAFEIGIAALIKSLHTELGATLQKHTTAAYKESKQALGFSLTQQDPAAIEKLIKAGGSLGAIKDFSSAQVIGFRDVFKQAYEDGLDLRSMVKEMQNYSDAQNYQLERIARTETNRFSNQGRFSGYKDLEEKRGEEYEYEWVGPQDERTTEICTDIKADNPYPLDELMQVTDGGEPHINCRHSIVRFLQ